MVLTTGLAKQIRVVEPYPFEQVLGGDFFLPLCFVCFTYKYILSLRQTDKIRMQSFLLYQRMQSAILRHLNASYPKPRPMFTTAIVILCTPVISFSPPDLCSRAWALSSRHFILFIKDSWLLYRHSLLYIPARADEVKTASLSGHHGVFSNESIWDMIYSAK